MKKTFVFLFLSYVSTFLGQNDIKNLENLKYNYVTKKPFLVYDPNKKDLDFLKYFKATETKTSLLVLYLLSKDSIKIISGGKIIKENRFPKGNTTSVRSIQPISNLKDLEIIFYRENGPEKINIYAEDLKKYKFVYLSTKQIPLELEFTNFWKMFM